MEFCLEEKYDLFRDEVKEFVKEHVSPYAKKFDNEQKLNRDVINKLVDKGYICSFVPKQYGGQELDNINIAILNEEVAKGCSATRSLLTVHGMCALGILRLGSEEQRQKYLPEFVSGKKIGAFALSEPLVGSDAKSIETVAEEDGEYYILNGRKKWITMAQIADVFLIFVQCSGKPTAFLLDRNTEGLEIKEIKDLLGCRGSMVGELILNNCRIPKNNLIGRVGAGLTHVALTCLDYGRFTIACGCVGIAQACLEECVEYASNRMQFNKPLKENQLIQKMITEMFVNIKAARALCLNTAFLKNNLDPDSIMETWNAKYFASTMLRKITADAIQIFGGNGVSPENNVERYYRDAIINEIIEGSTQVHEMLISSHVFRTY